MHSEWGDVSPLRFPPTALTILSPKCYFPPHPGSPQCYSSYDYVDRLLMTTLTPIAIEALLGVCFVLHVARYRRKGWRADGSDFHAIASTYVAFFLIVTYLVLPR